jgi:predicted outer membrane repeat protein
MRIEGFTIQGGVALTDPDQPLFCQSPPGYLKYFLPRNYFQAGIYYDSTYTPIRKLGSGAGIYNPYCSPAIEKCVIKKNWAELVGGGMFSRCSPVLTNCLFQQNVVYRNNGAGMYMQYAPACTLNGCVFDNNELIPIPGDILKGGAIYSSISTITGINSVFTHNSATDSGGAIYNGAGVLKIINCTFSGNYGGYGAGAIALSKKAKASIINTILWNPASIGEMRGDSFSVSYSCVRNGSTGNGNIVSNPLFVNSAVPAGVDGIYGTMDDGVYIQGSSPCIDAGKTDGTPITDIRGTRRPVDANKDIGAYEYFSTQGKFTYGKYTTTGFVSLATLPLITNASDIYDINKAIQGKMSAVLQVEVPANKYTEGLANGYGFVYTENASGVQISPKIKMDFYRVEGTQFFRTKIYSSFGDPTGKVVVAVTDSLLAEQEFDHVYVIYSNTDPGCHLKIQIPHDQ